MVDELASVSTCTAKRRTVSVFRTKKTAFAISSAVAITPLALLPAPAMAAELAELSGASYQRCWVAAGTYTYWQDGTRGGKPNYDTAGSAHIETEADCKSWVFDGELQYSGYEYRSGRWKEIKWQTAPEDDTPAGDYSYVLDLNDVRDIRLRVCNIDMDYKVGGCGHV
ncbi:hypothetical protein ACFV20_36720, partial [Streptomyces sp. NPDC059696]|uniref:hypothetical protein n=1 Tax=Streptomyces sp. NPDC059696 TaxID=3346911 RepID=UPI0036C06FE6